MLWGTTVYSIVMLYCVSLSRYDSLRLKYDIVKMEKINGEKANAMSIGEHGFMAGTLFGV